MRGCSASAARVLTLICLALLSTQSLLLVNAQSEPGPFPTDILDPNGPEEPEPEPSSESTTEFSTTTTSSSSISSSERPSSVSPTTTQPVREPTTTKPAPPPSSSEKSTSSISTTSEEPSSSESSSSSSSSSSDSSSSSSSSSSTLSSSSSSSSAGITLISNTGTTFFAPTPTRNVAAGSDTTSYNWLTPSETPSDGAVAGAVGASSSNFFDNKGAVAGTFSVVGVVALGGIIVAFLYAKRRAARLQDEEDMTYFEKYNGPSERASSPTDMSFIGGAGGREDLNDAPMATHAAADAYPDRSMHYGLPTMDEYSTAQPMGLNFGTGVEYPPGTSYDPSAYGGYEGSYAPAANQSYAPAANQNYAPATNQEYYDPNARRSPSSPNHPYADPSNSPRHYAAPPVQQYYNPNEVVHGEAR